MHNLVSIFTTYSAFTPAKNSDLTVGLRELVSEAKWRIQSSHS